MGYYHITLTPESKKLCTITLPWGKYEYQRLPMGLCNSPDIFQEKMSTLLSDLEYVRAYIDDLLIISNQSYEDHLEKLDEVYRTKCSREQIMRIILLVSIVKLELFSRNQRRNIHRIYSNFSKNHPTDVK